jgi:outer membrane protein TolC
MSRSKIAALALGALLAWSGQSAFAQMEGRGTATDLEAAEGSYEEQGTARLEESATEADRRPLDLRGAVALSIRNNLQVEVERYEPLIAETDAQGAWGAYDPTISADMKYDVQKVPNVFTLDTVETSRDRELGGGVGLQQLVPYLGATLDFRFDTSDTATRSTFQQLDPQYDSSFFMTATVPLARNLIWNQPWTQVKISGIGYTRSLETFRTSLMDIVQETADRYWELVAARDQVRVAEKSLETALALLDQTQTQYEVGVVSKVDVVEAEAGVASREFDLIVESNRYRNVQDQLIETVLGTELSALTDWQFMPTDDPEAYEVRDVDVSRAVETAFRKRPELEEVDQSIEQNEVDLKFAKNQRLPQLDAEVRYGYVGISGDGNDKLNPNFGEPQDRGSWASSREDWFTGDGAENVRVMGTFSIPFPNTTARKRVVKSQLELRRSKTRRVQLEQSIILEVRTAARTLVASAEGIEAAERRRLAAEEQLRAERIRLEHGESTPFDVLQREDDLVAAESQKIAALQSYRSAEIRLERAQGTILDSYAVVVDDARELVR